MAIVTSTFAPDPEPFPYQGMDDYMRQFSTGAQREVNYQLIGAAVAASGAGDNQRVVINCSLPVNHAYALVDITAAIEGETAATDVSFPNVLPVKIQNAATEGASSQLVSFELVSTGQAFTRSTNEARKTYVPPHLAKNVVLPAGSSSQIILSADVVNETANDQAYDVYFNARFLQFTIQQAFHWQVNSPVPVR